MWLQVRRTRPRLPGLEGQLADDTWEWSAQLTVEGQCQSLDGSLWVSDNSLPRFECFDEWVLEWNLVHDGRDDIRFEQS